MSDENVETAASVREKVVAAMLKIVGDETNTSPDVRIDAARVLLTLHGLPA